MSIPTLRANEDGWFYVHWSDKRRSKRKSLGTTDPRVAQKRFAEWLLLQEEPREDDEQALVTVADCWTVYGGHLSKTMTAETGDYAWKVLEPFFGALTVTQVDQAKVDEYVARRTSGRLGRKVQPQTTRRELQFLLAALRYCTVKPHRLFAAKLLEKITLPEAGAPRDRWLTTAEMKRMLDAAARLRRGTRLSRGERFLWIALTTAGRMQAILDLTWDRVDFETRVIHLHDPDRRATKKARASVPISTDLMPILQRAYGERQVIKEDHDGKRHYNPLVMDNKADVWATVQLIAIEAGLGGERPKVLRSEKPKATGISPHVLRHTAATHMARRGVPLWKIAKVLGNTLAMVEKVYAKHCPDDLREAVDLIGNGELEAAE
jgi:integrase